MRRGYIIIYFAIVAFTISCTTPSNNNIMRIFADKTFLLGESPWWDSSSNELVIIDIEGQSFTIFSKNGEVLNENPINGKPGTIIPTSENNYLLAVGNELRTYSRSGELIKTLEHLPFNTDSLRFNDGKCSPDGTFWIGTVECKEYSKPDASLYSYNSNGIQEVLKGITISNGISWSPDGKTMYYIDSPTKMVKAFDYDAKNHTINNERTIIKTPEDWGTPDGCCIDSNGNLWVAQWGGSCVALWNTQNGQLISKLDVPAKNVTAVALGGEKMNQLFITTAEIAMESDDVNKYPNAGKIFVATVEICGLNRTKWNDKE